MGQGGGLQDEEDGDVICISPESSPRLEQKTRPPRAAELTVDEAMETIEGQQSTVRGTMERLQRELVDVDRSLVSLQRKRASVSQQLKNCQELLDTLESRRVSAMNWADAPTKNSVIEDSLTTPMTPSSPSVSESAEGQMAAAFNRGFPWRQRLDEAVAQYYPEVNAFRCYQREAINATLAGYDCFLSMPTGYGKSLCYLLPGLVERSVTAKDISKFRVGPNNTKLQGVEQQSWTLVISPLISLMFDQVTKLRKLGLDARLLQKGKKGDGSYQDVYNAMVGKERAKKVAADELATGEEGSDDDLVLVEEEQVTGGLAFLFVTPERLASSKMFVRRLTESVKKGRVNRIVIDEAHCCSQWGHDFRPDYRKLRVCKELFPAIPILAVTATATPQVEADLKKVLCIEQAVTFRTSVDRENLYFSAVQKPSKMADQAEAILELIEAIDAQCKHLGVPQGSGLVYCQSKAHVEQLVNELDACIHSQGGRAQEVLGGCRSLAVPYHADFTAQYKRDTQTLWQNGRVRLIVATTAFGMGIDKANVRFVIHHTMSRTLEGYYQEAGRAGRDGLAAFSVVLYDTSDGMFLSSIASTVGRSAFESNKKMIGLLERSTTCKRLLLAEHFQDIALVTAIKNRGSEPAFCCDSCTRTSLLVTTADEEEDPQATLDATALAKLAVSVLGATTKSPTVVAAAALFAGRQRKAFGVVEALEKAPKELGKDKFSCERFLVQMVLEGLLAQDVQSNRYSLNCYLQPSGKGRALLQGHGTFTFARPFAAPLLEGTLLPLPPTSVVAPLLPSPASASALGKRSIRAEKGEKRQARSR